MIIPVLVYDYQYPLKANRDYFYIGKTLLSVCICILACYLLETDYIIPFVQMGKRISFYELLSRSILPVTLILVLIFYIVFECVCNFFGEISLFADRGFYK
jgi:sterol O-acyltransferase